MASRPTACLSRVRFAWYGAAMDAPAWDTLSDDALLELKIRGLGLRVEGSPVEPFVRQLYDELAAKGLVFQPPCHVGDEWFVPVGIPAIFIPFYLVHERLRAIELKTMLEVEGGTPDWFMKLMRHEAGHAYSYAYRLYRKRKWQETFGLASTDDPGFYRPQPYSRSYVIHLDDWYAQSHPDEDFAETFAIWLTPGNDWRAQYEGWGALAKLEYVDRLMASIAGKPPIHQPPYRVADVDCLNVKLKTHYARKRELFADTYPDFYDRDLRALFGAATGDPAAMPATVFLRKHRRVLLNAVCEWTNENKYRVSKLLSRLSERCDAIGVAVKTDAPELPFRVAAYVATLVMTYLFTGKFKRTK